MFEKIGDFLFTIWQDIEKHSDLYKIGAIILLLNGYFILPIEPIFSFFMKEEIYNLGNLLVSSIILFIDTIYIIFFTYSHKK